ncbi:radical SAM protein [Yoonia sediminilitoris]|uniref:Radical SAM family protein n=1 Tax=Yoonia sediminilitoris TaxID=1286148 RepID=A0A2T6KLG2_9RHOB|nr:radical SAM protein [Yoonia sediminilitoris]PUB17058.1 radical SAM family protein [Yoonia sediminilitoris]RCW97353.1 radical SAM family protein [Yoonia sediminilitoris]
MASSDFDVEAALRAVGQPGTRGGLTTPVEQLDQIDSLSLRGHEKYVSLTMEFRCNLKCVHCMIEGTMDRLAPTSDETFARVCQDQRENGRWDGLVLTGSEITLRRDLDQIARQARAAGFKHIRIQTHGMHLGRKDYADKLVDAGVDEFFVSVAGSDRESHDRITQVNGAWDKMMEGMAHLDRYDHVKIITNSVVTSESYTLLPGMVDALKHLKRLVQMEFWTYFPMAETDEKNLSARHQDILPFLRQAIADCRAAGRAVEVKNFPECLLGEYRDALVNAQPMLVIDPAFWTEFDRNEFHQCPHRAQCSSTECLGLTSAYIARFGDEADLLRPIP